MPILLPYGPTAVRPMYWFAVAAMVMPSPSIAGPIRPWMGSGCHESGRAGLRFGRDGLPVVSHPGTEGSSGRMA